MSTLKRAAHILLAKNGWINLLAGAFHPSVLRCNPCAIAYENGAQCESFCRALAQCSQSDPTSTQDVAEGPSHTAPECRSLPA